MYAPHTDADVRAMLDAIGVGSLASLAAPPKGLEIKSRLDVPPALAEAEAYAHLQALAQRNSASASQASGAT